MIEASIVLPLVLLVILSMLYVMMHDYETYQKQISVHEEFIQSWSENTDVFTIEKKTTETSSKISGAVELWLHEPRTYRSYKISPAKCIRIGEMVLFDTKE